MLTEQEVAAYINDRLSKNTLNSSSLKYTNKIKSLEKILESHTDKLNSLNSQIKNIELEIQRARGAISILLELVAEEENLIEKKAP
jgi:SMC interacting uncharacterized protein involved in chromosome segregation